MANSLNFLNKPAPAKPAPYGPQPKPGSAGSPTAAAPKAPFLDKSNPWAIPGRSTPPSASPSASSGQRSGGSAKPKTQTPAPKRSNVPSTGYNYTSGSNTGATPQQRAREVDQAQMSAQATAQRRERERQAAQQAAAQQAAAQRPPLKVQAREFGQPMPPPLPPWAGPQAASEQPIGLFMPSPQQVAQVAALPPAQPQPWNGAPPAFYDPEARFNEWQANQPPKTPAQKSPLQRLAETFARSMGDGMPAQPQSPLATPAGPRLNIPTTGYNYTDAPPGMTAPAPQPGTPATQQPAAPAGQQPPPLFYGYAAPGPLVAERKVELQSGQLQPWMGNARPLYTQIGGRAMMSDTALATEDYLRQMNAAGGRAALRQSGTYRPWNTLTDAEKYQRRFGVPPQGPQMAPNNASGVAALARADAQQQRLIEQYWNNYGNIIDYNDTGRGVRPPLGQYVGAPIPSRASTVAAIQRGPSGAAPAARQAAPTAVPSGNQKAINDGLLLQADPQVKIGMAPTEGGVTAVAREIMKRYRSELPADSMNLTDMVAILSEYAPPQDRAAMYNEDMAWLAQFYGNE